MEQCLRVEYSLRLYCREGNDILTNTILTVAREQGVQSHVLGQILTPGPDCSCCPEEDELTAGQEKSEHTRKISIAVCFPLSWKLFMYARETLLVASESTPARVRFPLRV